jgi:hypothetical protein
MKLTTTTLIGIAIFAFVIRLIFCFYLFPVFFYDYGTVGVQYIFDDYYEIARQLLTGKGFSLADGTPVLHRPPFFSLVLTIPLLLSPGLHFDTSSMQIFNALLGSLSVAASMLLTRQLLPGRIGLVCAVGIVTACWPFSIWISKTIIAENLLLFLVPLQFYFLFLCTRESISSGRRTIYAIASGLLAGMLYLTHAGYLAFIGGTLIAILLVAKKHCILIVPVYLCSLLCIATPWIYRNHSLGYTSPSSATGFGLHYFKGWFYFTELKKGNPYFLDLEAESALYANNHISSDGLQPVHSGRDRSNPENMKNIDALAKTHLVEHLPENLLKTMIKIPLLWVRQQSATRALVNTTLILPLIVLAGLALCTRRRPFFLLTLPTLTFSAAMALVFIEDAPMRYALPHIPALTTLAAIGLSRLLPPNKNTQLGQKPPTHYL